MSYSPPIEHKKKRLPLDRRIGRDDSRLTEDINMYRWFCVFIKCALELEGKTFKIRGKNYKVKFNRNHKWWKDINLKSFPKRPKFIRFNYYKLQADIKRLSDPFISKHKHLFEEKSTLINVATKSVPRDYDTLHIPPNYPIMKILSDVRKFYSGKEVKLSSGRKKKSAKGYNADIVLGDSNEQLMKRLFHTLSISQSRPDLTGLDVYFNVQKRMNKNFVIPKIERVNASGAIGSRTRTTRGDYESENRSTMRDMRWSKIILINLCNGVFPELDKII